MKKVATIILNRNLPDVTNNLYEHIYRFDDDITDIYVVEAGSDPNKLSKYVTWYASDDNALKKGLRYCRGMNFALANLFIEGKFEKYDAFFLLTNDTEFDNTSTIAPLMQVLNDHPYLGILSPCSNRWGEKLLLQTQKTKYFWFIHNNAYLLRRGFIEAICNAETPDYMSFLFDGNNFRGYGSEHELIAKAYANDWAAAITSEVWASENESYLLENADQIKTEGFHENFDLYITEGKRWMKQKYGFNSHWTMQKYVKSFYDQFFEFHPECSIYKV